MLFVTWALIGTGLLMIAGASFWSWGIAAQESPAAGSRSLWPVDAWIYVITRWEEMRRPFPIGPFGVASMLLGLAVGLATGGL